MTADRLLARIALVSLLIAFLIDYTSTRRHLAQLVVQQQDYRSSAQNCLHALRSAQDRLAVCQSDHHCTTPHLTGGSM